MKNRQSAMMRVSMRGSLWFLTIFGMYAFFCAPILLADSLPLDAAMISLDHQNFPFIYLNVAVDRYGEGISTLVKANFHVTENEFSQTGTEYFDVTPPDEGGDVRWADIVFVLDVTGSMGGEIEAVRTNMLSFMDALNTSDINYRVGFVVFGDVVYVYNDGNLYTEQAEILSIINNVTLGEHGIGSGDDSPENQFEAMAQATSMNYRSGTQRVQILLTDAPAHEADDVTDWTRNTVSDLLVGAGMTVFPVFDTAQSTAREQYIAIAEATNPKGTYFNIYDNFNTIIDEIALIVASTYIVQYKSSNPVFDGTERHVVVTVNYLGDQATCDGTYIPGSAPKIGKITVHDTSAPPWTAGTPLTVEAEITDEVAPYVDSATLYYRKKDDVSYTPTPMTHSSDIWVGTIPSSAVKAPWLAFYISATDTETTVTDPSTDPGERPHQIAILPNVAPAITHTPPADVPDDTSITITAEISDTTNSLASARLYYRKVGKLDYQCNGEMTNTGGDNYRDTIPREFVTPAGVEYYILAVDDLGTENSFGTRDKPQQVWISTNKPPEIERIEYFILGNTATFDWKGIDDNTPIDQLEYSCRLIAPGRDGNPDYTKYDWTKWTSERSKTYKDLISGHYTFEVHARDGDGAINGRPEAEEFTIGGPTGKVPVIIIPGIMGSELFRTWPPPEDRLWPDIAGPDLLDPDQLKLTASGDDLGSVSIRVGDVLREGLLHRSKNVYGKLIKCLTDTEYKEEEDLFVFPYDWRKDLSTTSIELAKTINEILMRTGAEKVDIVAHSMGGLVARYYINKSSKATPSVFYQSAGNVRKLLLLATPSHGSPDAFQALHTELGRGLAFLSNEKAQELSANSPAAYQLLPTEEFFELYEYIFRDWYGPVYTGNLVGSTPAETWALTYLENEDSNLKGVNSYLLRDASFSAYTFHRELGSALEFTGETYIIVGSGSPTKTVFVKKDSATTTSRSTPSTMTWFAVPSNGDGTVPLLSVTELATSGALRIFHVDVEHSAIPNNKNVRDLVLAILQDNESEIVKIKERRTYLRLGSYEVIEEKSLLDGNNDDQAHDLKDTAIFVIKSPVELHIYNSEGNHTGPDGDGFIETADHTDFFKLASNTVAFVPMEKTYELEMRGTGTGTFGLEIMEFDGESMMRVFSFENIDVTSSSRGTLTYMPLSAEYPSLSIDTDGDGSVDKAIAAEPGNTPIGSDVSIAFHDELFTVFFNEVTSAGCTICLSVKTLDNLDSAFTPVSPFYFLSTSAEFTGFVSITIQYDEDDVPAGRESDLKLYRITGEDAIEDITQKLDRGANTVTGQTDGFSYFVVGYMNASPETSILSPTTGDTVTGQSCAIQWQVNDPDHSADSLSIDLLYSADEGNTWSPISSNETNDGVYEWDISALRGGEYWLKIVAEDPEGATAEATTGPFTISTFEGHIIGAPNPVTNTGTAFFYALPEDTSTAKLMIFNVAGRPVFETDLEVDTQRFPPTGTWNPVDQDGVPLANGPYIYVLVADGKVIGRGKMVIQR